MNKKKLLFTAYNLGLGGIEKALVNLLNRIDYDKYEVTLILEKKEGIFLNSINKNVIIKELKVSDNKIVLLRKVINYLRKFNFKLKNKNKYDFSCCYATYSYSSAELALIASNNTVLYIHGNYNLIYKDEKDFYNFFDSRKIDKFNKLIFVSNESKNDFINRYSNYKDKCLVFNNFIDTKDIIEKSNEKIDINKKENNLLVYVGRLEDNSKKIFRQIDLIKNIPNTELWLVGDGPDREKYENKIIEEKLTDRIKLLGQKENPYPYMKKGDYIILTSEYEGFPVTYLEAIALNKDIITTIPTSDDEIDIREYGHIISKDKNTMINEVKEIINNKNEVKKIDLEEVQNNRMKEIEKLFNGVI